MTPVKKVLGDRILIKLPEVKEVTDGGIIKPDEVVAQEAVQMEEEGGFKAVATYVGNDCKFVKVGDILEIDNAHLPVITIHNERYAAIYEHNVICIVNEIAVDKTITA